jgi:type IV pilus assembly protein PilC
MTITDALKHQFYSEMAKLLEAGFGIREAAAVMMETGLPAAQAALVRELHQGLEQGKSITDSLASNQETVSNLERNILGAGERGGRLPSAMRHLADYFGMLASARREAWKGLIHPVIVLHLGVFIGTVPTAMLEGTKSGNAIAIGFFLTLLAAYAITFVLFLGIRAMLRAARTHARIDRFLGRIPLIGKARSNLAMAGFCKVHHICLLAAIPMRQTVRMAADASHSGMIIAAGNHLEQTVEQGQLLGPAMLSEPSFPKTFARSYATGEAAGTLDKDLEHWGRLFLTNAEVGARSLSTVLPKALYFIIMIYVGWKIYGFYTGYYDGLLKQLEG